MTLHLSDWRTALGDVEVDACITDCPYSERTIHGQRSSTADGPSAKISYGPMSTAEQAEFVDWADEMVRTFFVAFCDHLQVRAYDDLFGARADRWLTFAPVAWIKTNPAPRMGADGPSPHVEWIYVARRRRRLTRPEKRDRKGYYITPQARGSKLVGAKPLEVMLQVVRDYSEPGALVADPFAGTGTTALACVQLGRRFVGAEIDPETHAIAAKRYADALAVAAARAEEP